VLNIFKWGLQVGVLIGLSGSSLEHLPNFNALPDITIPVSDNYDTDIITGFSLSDLFMVDEEKRESNGVLESADQEENYIGCNGDLSEMSQAQIRLPLPDAL
jgi:hypothetical protein